ncbi:raffinose/stachyose/melibiose transport system permease protein [Gracilibacillus orientalis]|uniref:Raffinose/stachyose/melibiose transport system permease protein n=1 Tax=Gracilibacillus orientalis TaxID=334253 RepID=A0A1I4HRQ7_9BACI|nr:carbohydrate ABC transporter permease [Gracilibacillus orientalis]SFL44998.1 raffinose/stachyose/melibiose transport system permease protein [Gracilibacillus orientalis]
MISTKSARLVIHVLLILFGIVWIYPFVWMVFSSLKTNQEFLTSGTALIPEEFQWENYTNAWHTANFSGYFLNTIIFTVATVVIVIFLSALTGYALGRIDFPGKKIIMICVVAIMFIPKGYTIIPLFKLVSNMGLSDSILGIIVAEASGAHVLFILMFASFFANLPKSIEEAAEIDGAGFLTVFSKVMLPLSMPIVATTAIMQFIWTWSSFLVPLVLTISKPELRTLAVGMQSFVQTYAVDFSGMAAGATISLLPVMIIFIIMQRYFIEGVAGAVKS